MSPSSRFISWCSRILKFTPSTGILQCSRDRRRHISIHSTELKFMFNHAAFVYIYLTFTSLEVVVELCTLLRYEVIGLLQQTITWYKIRHTGGQAHYYSRTGTLKQRPVTLDWLRSLCFNVPVRE